MDKIIVQGGIPLHGTVTVSGAKNAALPLLFASLLTQDECTLRRIPRLVDIQTALRLLKELGVQADRRGAQVPGPISQGLVLLLQFPDRPLSLLSELCTPVLGHRVLWHGTRRGAGNR